MRRAAHALFLLALLLVSEPSVFGAALPEFESNYNLPTPSAPAPRGELPDYTDVAVLIGSLTLAAWLALKQRSRQCLFLLTVASMTYFGFVRHGCVCAVGSVQNMALACCDRNYAVPLSVAAFFFLPLLAALFFGRVFCSGVCPLGAIQDVFLLRPVKVPRWLEHALGLLAWIYLGAAILFAATSSAFIICEYDPFISFFRRTGSLNMLLLGSSFLLLSMFVGRPYCRFLCPYGTLLGFFSRFSRKRVTITPSICIQCRLCEEACPFGAIDEPDPATVRERRMTPSRIVGMLALLILLVAGGGWGGKWLGPAFAKMHATVRLAERVSIEDAGLVATTTDASDAFRRRGQAPQELYAQAALLRSEFSTWGLRLGLLVGAVVGLKLISLSVRRKQLDWEANRANCLACARCFESCPQERVRRQALGGAVCAGGASCMLAANPADNVLASTQLPTTKLQSGAAIARASACVAGAFSLTVLIFMLFNYANNVGAGPLNNAQMTQLREAAHAAPQDQSIRERIRELDLNLRVEFFQRQRFSETGGSLLLTGIVAFLIALKTNAEFQKRLPQPQLPSDARAQRQRIARISRYAVATLAMTVGSASAVLAVSFGKGAMPVIAASPSAECAPPSVEELQKNWPVFRGPNSGVAISLLNSAAKFPEHWDGKTNDKIIWKTSVPLPGESSPIVWNDRLFITGSDGKTNEVYCFDSIKGLLLWKKNIESEGAPPKVNEATGFAAPTPATDGHAVYAIFAHGTIAALDFGGKQIWRQNLGPLDNHYGHASSLTLAAGHVIVQLDQAGADDNKSKLLALDSATGKILWQTPRKLPCSWSSPLTIRIDNRELIVAVSNPFVAAYDAGDGAEVWRAEALSGETAPSPAYADGLVYAAQEGSRLAAIRADGHGDVSQSHLAWGYEENLPDICSPLSDGKITVIVQTGGTVTCLDAKKGTRLWSKEVEAEFHASPSLANGKLFLLSKTGTMFLLSVADGKELGRSELGEHCNASPAFVGNRIFIRGKSNLYCIGNAQP
ncbi:MAG TPA: PQQ-binding-like beta-propeller repeat protein [Planctomycetota bacterium]|nr:PQQ-binding-like beta-propeller repeat protein [Planctomycetota bacterium]